MLRGGLAALGAAGSSCQTLHLPANKVTSQPGRFKTSFISSGQVERALSFFSCCRPPIKHCKTNQDVELGRRVGLFGRAKRKESRAPRPTAAVDRGRGRASSSLLPNNITVSSRRRHPGQPDRKRADEGLTLPASRRLLHAYRSPPPSS